MQIFKSSPLEILRSLCRHWTLLSGLTQREVIGRYRGSVFGLLWSFLNPLFMLSVYTFVFSAVMKARWGSGSESETSFALVLFAGLIAFNIFSECVTRAPSLILSNPNYVKKVVFPLEILPWVTLGSSLFHAMVNLAVWLSLYGITEGIPKATVLLLPIVILPLLAISMGFSWFLASIGVFFRDASQMIGVITTALMFLSPIFYPISSVPPAFQTLFLANPLTYTVEITRDVLVSGKSPEWSLYARQLTGSVLILWAGFFWFQKTRKGFADVI